VGTSGDHNNIEEELEKVRATVEAGADTIMDLSTGQGIDETRKAVMKASTVPVGTVPIYQAGIRAIDERGAIVKMTVEDLFEGIEDEWIEYSNHIHSTNNTLNGDIESLRYLGQWHPITMDRHITH
jgi:phosphomethylpyrimidine synthase